MDILKVDKFLLSTIEDEDSNRHFILFNREILDGYVMDQKLKQKLKDLEKINSSVNFYSISSKLQIYKKIRIEYVLIRMKNYMFLLIFCGFCKIGEAYGEKYHRC